MRPGNFIDCEQGSAMWAELRCGLVTASRASDVIATTKKGEAAARRDYRMELIIERLTGVPYPQYVSRGMQWGLDQEPFARAAYEVAHDVLVETCGFVLHPEIPRFGGSPDGGLVTEDGLIEIKCPTTPTHLAWVLAGTVPVEHAAQMLALMAVTGRAWCDFVSFDPRLPEHLQLFVRRFERKESLIMQLEREVVNFNREIDGILSALPGKPQGVVIAMDQENEDEVQF